MRCRGQSVAARSWADVASSRASDCGTISGQDASMATVARRSGDAGGHATAESAADPRDRLSRLEMSPGCGAPRRSRSKCVAVAAGRKVSCSAAGRIAINTINGTQPGGRRGRPSLSRCARAADTGDRVAPTARNRHAGLRAIELAAPSVSAGRHQYAGRSLDVVRRAGIARSRRCSSGDAAGVRADRLRARPVNATPLHSGHWFC